MMVVKKPGRNGQKVGKEREGIGVSSYSRELLNRIIGKDGRLSLFCRSYLEAALGSSRDQDNEPMDRWYSTDDISDGTLDEMIGDCLSFFDENWESIREGLEIAAYDFWHTRNGRSMGFWAGDKDAGEELKEKFRKYGPYFLYVGKDRKIHGMRGTIEHPIAHR